MNFRKIGLGRGKLASTEDIKVPGPIILIRGHCWTVLLSDIAVMTKPAKADEKFF